ncbi:gliding motility-associated C-terminal domain-containing protein [Spirosoma utsteinense]|uniref:Gliding motility-associated-like protein n=1 Tax=Spirosoma utsteinense TaxID=2585773 RepID=A0ABR6VZQ6_9BACT|nr:gliding motility-associated C-terminal domain-containing protein [Spirosoma utsteinense]MBC3789090.1 gliding motility-associated-like protein [Spirosoma utsteinense]MBC3789788.1 gliding motility-associated-like protein [Spirosoma utsteinense]
MPTTTLRMFVVLILLLTSVPVLATHQVGGQLEMRAVGNRPGQYRIIVTNYFEAGRRADQQSGGPLGIFRQRDNQQMLTFQVRETGQRENVIYANEFCAELRNLKFVVATFEADLQLDPATYSDPQGYYISYQTRNRNAGIDNLVNPLLTGFTFYLAFPALQQNGLAIPYSSPRFPPINGEYVCVNEPFSFPFGGTDPDGDELRYSMVTPLDQKNTGRTPTTSPGPYPDVVWQPGYGASNAIPGSPALTIDSKTGQLSVTATQLGLFVFAVKVEEYRNGVKLGEVRRDFQFLVVDCPPTTTPNPAIQVMNRPTDLRTVDLCYGDSARVQATLDTSWNYQWRRDGVNLPNANGSTLTVRESGDYTVLVSPKKACSKVGNSQTITVRVVGQEATLGETGHLCATTGTVDLAVTNDTGVVYQWYRNDVLLAGRVSDSVRVEQEGRYRAGLTYTRSGCTVSSNTLSLARSAAVQATLTSTTGINRLCPQDSLPLLAGGGTQYIWERDGQVIAGATTAQYRTPAGGTFILTAIDENGCRGVSTPLVIVPVPPVTVRFDSIPGVCGPDVPAYTLRASPPGGEFDGPGVIDDTFSARSAGVGNHPLTYTVKPAPECAGTVASRVAVVAPIPTIQLPDSLITYRGNTLALAPAYTGNPVTFEWSPPTYLDNPSMATPSAVSIDRDITYTLTVGNETGCTTRDTVHITVYERVWIPDAFSPNSDGLNDVWVLSGIEAFPQATVTVFNRWGEVIYQSDKGYHQPFDGRSGGIDLPTGLYPYTLHTLPDKPVMRGRVVIVR